MNVFLKIGFFFSFLFSFLASAEVARPNNLKLEPPRSDVPFECAVFFSQNGWGGRWEDGMSSVLWVEEVRPDCTMQIVYAWGIASVDNTTKPKSKYDRVEGVLKDGRLLVILADTPTKSIIMTFTVKNQDELDVHYERAQSNKKKVLDTVFQRGNTFD